MPDHAPPIDPHGAIYRQVILCFRNRDRASVLRASTVRLLSQWGYEHREDYVVLERGVIEELGTVSIQLSDAEAVLDVLRRANSDKDTFVGADTNRPFRLTMAPPAVNDPRYWEQWSLTKISAEAAWQRSGTAPPVVVGIIDTGISINHPDLQPHLWSGLGGNHGFNVLDGSSDVDDRDGHGTLLAGTIGAVSDNGIGIAAANWPIELMAVKIEDVRTPPNVLNGAIAIVWAVTQGARVINAAWDVGLPHIVLELAIAWAKVAGVVFVAGAGNDGLDNDRLPTYPASYPFDNVISVMASDEGDDRPGFANYGLTTVHIGAPGVRILSTHSYFVTPRWRPYSGSSPACAHVAGAAALVLALASTPAHPIRPVDLRTHLMNSADPAPLLTCVARGRLNLGRAVRGPIRIVSPQASDTWAPGANVQVTWQNEYPTPLCATVSLMLSDNGGPYAVLIDNVPNTGACQVAAPNRNIAHARLRVQSLPSTAPKPGLYTESAVFRVGA
jgi:subtilisin family serine protease